MPLADSIVRVASGVWRCLPIGARRGAVHYLVNKTSFALPRASRDLVGDRRVPRYVAGLLSSNSGLGQSARLAAKAFAAQGYRVYGLDLSRFFGTADAIPHGIPNGYNDRSAGHLVIVINAPYMRYACWLLGREFLKNKYITGYWAWELPNVPRDWERGFEMVHEIAVPSSFVADAVKAHACQASVRVAGHPALLDHPPLAQMSCRRRRPFTAISIASIASGFERKNPIAIIRAFKLAFGKRSNCRLRMLITLTEHHVAARDKINDEIAHEKNIEVTWRSLDRQSLWSWWSNPDVYVSLHRSEGFGLPLAEAMCAGYPVLATGWSGNMDFMTTENSIPVGYQLIDVHDPQMKYSATEGKWAEPDIEHAAQLLRKVEDNWALRLTVAKNAQKAAKELFSSHKFVKAMVERAPQYDCTPKFARETR